MSDPDVQMLHTLWAMGRKYIFSWIISTAKVTAEIEKIGKSHYDIESRNTVNFAGIFKIIHFDYLFTVKQVGRNKADIEAYEHMQHIITKILRKGKLNKGDYIIAFFSLIGEPW